MLIVSLIPLHPARSSDPAAPAVGTLRRSRHQHPRNGRMVRLQQAELYLAFRQALVSSSLPLLVEKKPGCRTVALFVDQAPGRKRF